MATFPTGVQTFPTSSGSEVLNSLGSGTGLAGMLNLLSTDLTAVEAKLGTGSSTAASNQLLVGTGTGTSAWQGLTSAQLASILSDETGSGAAVFANSPTIITPTIASLTNMQHNHTNAAGGGQLSNTSFATGTIGTDKLTVPYKFRVYRNAAQNIGNTDTKIQFDTRTFDTGSNFDITTNFRFVAPIAGFYYVHWALQVTQVGSGTYQSSLYKNGSVIAIGGRDNVNTVQVDTSGADLVSLAANDYLEIFATSSTGSEALQVGSTNCYFSGFLISST